MARTGVIFTFLALIAVHTTTAWSRARPFHSKLQQLLARMHTSATRQHETTCPEGGMNLVATDAVQTFSLLQYANYMDCTWDITTQDDNMVVYINIANYAIEHQFSCGYDYLSVNEGDACEHKLCGMGSFQGHSVGNTMGLHFHSDCSIVHNGFTVEYSQVAAVDAPPHESVDTMVDGAVIALTADMDEYVLASHGCHASAEDYANYINYTTTVTAPQGMAVQLTVQQFHLEGGVNCPYDWVSVYNNAGALISTWCGTDGNGQQAISADSLTIWWHTDYSVTASGFLFDFSLTDASAVPPYQGPDHGAAACPGPFTQDLYLSAELVIASPNYGTAQYENNMDCSWLITTAPGQVLSVTILQMSIEHHSSCAWDALSLYDGEAHLIASLCGTSAPQTFYTSGAELLITFTTDGSVTSTGFELEVTATDAPADGGSSATVAPTGPASPDACTSAAGPTYITEAGVTIANPVGSNGQYYPNMECSWIVQSPDATQTVTFIFNSFSLEGHSSCAYDSLALYNSDMADPDTLIGMYCGSTSPDRVTSQGNVMFIQFKSDYSVQSSGFSGSVSFGHETPTEPAPTTGVSSGGDNLPAITNTPLSNYTCGTPAITHNVVFDRIVGGSEAVPGSWPWTISLRRGSNIHGTTSEGSHTCGGVILSDRWVISAAHCISNGVQYKIVAGDHTRGTDETFEQVREVTQIIVNSHYATDGDRDAALLYLSEPLTFNDRVKPICITTEDVPVGTNCVATGWGTTHGTGDNTVLRQVPLPILSDDYCRTAYGGSITPYTVCAGYEQGGRDTCQGDSGGPLVCEINGSWQLHGLTSFGIGCADPGYPGVYARVAPLVPWIQAYTNNGLYLTENSMRGQTIEPRPDDAARMINWSRIDGKARRQEMTEALWKRELAELTQKGAENSEKLVQFLRTAPSENERHSWLHFVCFVYGAC